MNLPFKTRIVEYAIDRAAPATAGDIYEDLKWEYPERQCSVKNIEHIMMSLVSTGILKVAGNDFDSEDRLVTRYVITKFGCSCASYIPQTNN